MTVDVFVQAREPAPSLPSPAPLTHRLTRNTIFNIAGWAWPICISLITVPYVVHKLGTDGYGVYALISILAGYLGLLNGPVSMGNLRFMAEAYGRSDWEEFWAALFAGTLVAGAFGALGALALVLASGFLARDVFKVPAPLAGSAVLAFRLAAASFLLNSIGASLGGVPAAMRRYGAYNLVSVGAGSLNTFGVVGALWLGLGLPGAVIAAVASSAIAAAAFAVLAYRTLHAVGATLSLHALDGRILRRLLSFSGLLFGSQIGSQIGLQIDRTLIGVLLGPTAVTYYTVPARITDQIPGFMYRFTVALYPLSAEGIAAGQLDELRRLYQNMLRLLFWASALMATEIIVLSRDFLTLWVGPSIAGQSYLIMALLAAAAVWRVPGSVAYQVSTGLGRADVTFGMAWVTAVSLAVPVGVLAFYFGSVGAAAGVFIGLMPCNLVYDLYTQRRLLGQESWRASLLPYLRVLVVMAIVPCVAFIVPLHALSWAVIIVKATVTSGIYFACSVALRMLTVADAVYLLKQLADATGRVPRTASEAAI